VAGHGAYPPSISFTRYLDYITDHEISTIGSGTELSVALTAHIRVARLAARPVHFAASAIAARKPPMEDA
jgi:hypothetical protein